MDIGAAIRKVRKDRGITQIELAEKVGMAVNSIRLYEAGKRIPSIEQRVKISEILDCSAYDLMTEEEIKVFKASLELGYWAREDELRSMFYEFRDIPPGDLHPGQMQAIISWAKDKRKGRLMAAYDLLGDTGQRIAVEQVEALTKQPELLRTDTAEQPESANLDTTSDTE